MIDELNCNKLRILHRILRLFEGAPISILAHLRQLSKEFWDRAILGQSNFRTKQFMDKTIYRQSKVMGFDPKVINLVFYKNLN